MARRATTISLDDETLAAVEDTAARTGTSPQEVIEDAVRVRFALQGVLDQVWCRLADSDLTEDGSLDVAYTELRAMRAERGGEAAG